MTFPTTLVTGQNIEAIEQTANQILSKLNHLPTNNPDLFVFTEYTIAEVRQLPRFLSQKPHSHNSLIVLIHNVDKLNIESQNALLKMLEEPGEGNYFILTSTRPGRLLPTITSRCHHLKISSTISTTGIPLVTPMASIKDSLALSDSQAITKDNAIEFFTNQISAYHQEFINNPSTKNAVLITRLQKSLDMVNSNVDPKSALDYFLLI